MTVTFSFINAVPRNNIVLLSSPFMISTNQPYVNIFLSNIQVAQNILIPTAIHYSLNFQILIFLHLNKLHVILFIFSFKLRHIRHPIICSQLYSRICGLTITNNFLFFTSIYCYLFFKIVTIQHLKLSFAAVLHIMDFVEFELTICFFWCI